MAFTYSKHSNIFNRIQRVGAQVAYAFMSHGKLGRRRMSVENRKLSLKTAETWKLFWKFAENHKQTNDSEKWEKQEEKLRKARKT